MDVARGEVTITLNDRDAIAGLHRVRGEFEREMAAMDRERAVASIDADATRLKREVEEAKRKLLELKGERAEVELGVRKGSLARYDAEIEKAKLKVDELNGKHATVQIKAEGAKQAIANMNAVDAATKRAQRAAERRDKAEAQIALNEVRRGQQILRKQEQYAKLANRAEFFAKKERNSFGETKIEAGVAKRGALKDMEVLKFELNRMGAEPPVKIKADIDRSLARRSWEGLKGTLSKWASELGTTTLRLGPFTTSIRGLIGILSVAGPLLVSLVGAAGALASAVGVGLAGSAALGAGALTGFGLAAIGVMGSLKPLITQYHTASLATQGYQRAVLQYGKNSKQAKTAQDKMNQALKGVDPVVRQAAKGTAELSTRWQQLTHAAAGRSFGTIVSEGLKTANALLPMFAARTKDTLASVATGFQGWMQQLRGGRDQGLLDNIFGNFNQTIQPVMSGLGQLMQLFLRVSSIASNFLPGLAQGFQHWATALNSVSDSKLSSVVGTMIARAKSLGSFLKAAAGWLARIMFIGSGPGAKGIDDMTNKIKDWNKALDTPAGKDKAHTFFQNSMTDAKAFITLVAPLARTFLDWAAALAPVTTELFKILSYVAKAVGWFLRLPGLAGPIGVLATTIAAAFAVTKTAAFIGFLAKALGYIKDMRAAWIAVRGAEAGAGVAGALGAAAQAVKARRAAAAAGTAEEIAAGAGGAGATGVAARAAQGAAGATAGGLALGAAARIVGSRLLAATPIVAAYAAAIYGLSKAMGPNLAHNVESAGKSLSDVSKATAPLLPQFRKIEQNAGDVGSAYQKTQLGVRAAREELARTTPGTLAHAMALQHLRDALRANNAQAQQWAKAAHNFKAADDIAFSGAQKRKKAADNEYNAWKRQLLSRREAAHSDAERARIDAALARNERQHAAATASFTRALNIHAAAAANLKRTYLGLPAVTGKAEQALGALARQVGGAAGKKLTTQIAIKYPNPADVQRVSAAASSALKAGVPLKKVMNVVANTRSAEQALARLNAVKMQAKLVHVRSEIGAALVGLARVRGIKLSAKTVRAALHGDKDVINRLAHILHIHLPTKSQKLVEHGGSIVLGIMARILARRLGRSTKTLLQIGGARVLSVMAHILGFRLGRSTKQLSEQGYSNVHGKLQGLKFFNNLGTAVKHIITSLETRHKGKATGGVVAAAAGDKTGDLLAARQDRALTQATLAGRTDGLFRRPALLVGEEDRAEYVISTNPTYRARNINFLKAAAAELGVQVVGAATGSADWKQVLRAHPAAGLNEEPYQRHVDQATTERDHWRTLTRNEEKKRGRHGGRDEYYRRRWAGAGADLIDWTRQLNAVKGINKRIADINAQMENLTSAMNNAAATNNKPAWDRAHGAYMRMLFTGSRGAGSRTHPAPGTLLSILSYAKKFSEGTEQYAIDAQLQTAIGAAIDAQGAAFAAPDLATMLQRTPGAQSLLDTINLNAARARLNNVDDNPGTPSREDLNALQDDLAAAKQLQSFYSGLYGGGGSAFYRSLGVPAKTELIGAVADANESVKTINDQFVAALSATTPSQGEIFSNERTSMFEQFGSNFSPFSTVQSSTAAASQMSAAFAPSVSGLSPSASTATASGDTKVINVTNNYPFAPPDTHSYSRGMAFDLQAAL